MDIYDAIIRVDAVGDKDSVSLFIRGKDGGAGIALKNVRLNRAEWKALVSGVEEIFESDRETEVSFVFSDAEVWSEGDPPS